MKPAAGWMASVALFMGLAALAGCVDTAGTTVLTDPGTGSTLVLEDNTRLKDEIQVVRVNYDEVNGLKRVHISLASTRHAKLDIQCRIAWFDGNGMELDPDSRVYRNLTIQGRDTVTLTGVAGSPAAATSKLRVRAAAAAD